MASRRSSARLSGGGEALTDTRNGVTGSWVNGVARKRDEVFGMGIIGPESKKRKKEVKKVFKPQPVPQQNSSDTPPEEIINLPPPPSEKKIARRRESTRAIRERSPLSPDLKKQRTGLKQRSKLPELSQSSKTHSQPIDFLEFSAPSRPRASMPRPSSPPRRTFLSSSISKPSSTSSTQPSIIVGNMAPPPPPPTGGFIRKTRKSMMGTRDLTSEALVPVPDSETPMIKKNREIREAQARRSSMGMRGQRASSSLGRGDISIPHHSVESSNLYKHISTTLPEPIRARHLLVYCSKRATDDELEKKGKGKQRDMGTEEGDKLVREIMEEFMMTLGKGGIDTNVFAGAGGSTSVPLRPHPRNNSNKEVEAKMNSVIKRCKEEDRLWSRLIHLANEKQAKVVKEINSKLPNPEPSFTNLSIGDEWMSRALTLAEEVINEGEGNIEGLGDFGEVEFKVDNLHHLTHTSLQYSLQATRFLDGIFSSLISDLQTSPSQTSHQTHDPSDTLDPLSLVSVPSGSRKKEDTMVMLRTLASIEGGQSTFVSDSAPASGSGTGSGSGVGIGVGSGLNNSTNGARIGMTPRRMGTTPRRGR
ncbi:hypothetical protein TREMEDRAFT_63637 [Tremella mesenterica DSM 1558]|uniref:uncharacterized protein n=1 Tax=Tremella mesenterica (strain ATCC 24925 / CBS 8224 / DSM 1558 / NBRC 9311 / NRRL Y-6157 / RJB 2259-6 / UBC 559-6) TaxID=578456 RepID=UPI0003F4951A|nr:uncharacterized protein TREMEDRAFT_63637 [Tremella mesenterica DSM 1558]EIW68470.1 hypothetical protein TREMEDRAFT_63637 [Tremella mesenterica DSM 1558]